MEDIPKTAFITLKGTYAYIKMLFGLKMWGPVPEDGQQSIQKAYRRKYGVLRRRHDRQVTR